MSELMQINADLASIPASVSEDDKLKIQDLLERITSVPEGLEGDYRWRPSRLKLQHPTTSDPMAPEDGRPGDYFAEGETVYSGKSGTGWPFIPLLMWTSHARFEEGGTAPACSSDDGEWSRSGLSCARCPMNPTYDKAPCRRAHEVVLLASDLSNVYQLSLAKTSYAAGSILRKFMQVPRSGQNLVARLGSESKKNTAANSTYFVSTISKSSDARTEAQNFAVSGLRPFIQAWRQDMLSHQAKKRSEASQVFDSMPEGEVKRIETVQQDDGFSNDM